MNLNLFTNCTDTCLSNPTIFKTLDSFKQTFGEAEISIYLDPNPNRNLLQAYSELIYRTLGVKPTITSGLADGYMKSLLMGKSKYIFQLEHDWTFQNITHSSNEIIEIMERDNLWFMLFNKHPNNGQLNGTKWQSYFTSTNRDYCLTDRISNNPHIINREYYLKNIAPKINWTAKGAGQIEQVLQKSGLECAVYGKYSLPPTVKHLNGRKGGLK